MKYIIFLSSASMYFRLETLKTMLTSFRLNNEANHITGMMLFSDGNFLQVLEGEGGDMDTLVKKIKKDKRHHSLIQIAENTIEERIFEDWKMSFKVDVAEEEAFRNLKGYVNPWDPDFLTNLQQNEHPALAVLKVFAENSRIR